MSSELLSRATETSFSSGKRNIAIAELVLFSLVHLIQIPVRYMQEWRYWHHDKRQHPARCCVYSWWSMVGLLAQIRIAGSAMVLSTSHPSSAMLIAESAMQSIGLSPLLFEVSLVLLRCGEAGEHGPGKSKYSKWMRFTLHFFRFPIFIAIVLAIVGRCVDIHPLGEAGSVVLVVSFAFVCGLVAWLAMKTRSTLPVAGHRGVLLTLLALPFLLVRVVYFMLLAYGPARFGPASGDIRILAGMGPAMEICIVVILLAARAVVEPIWTTENKRLVESTTRRPQEIETRA